MRAVLRLIRREPLIVFLLLGGTAGFAYAGLRPSAPEQETIHIRRSTVEAMVRQEEELSGVPLDAEARARMLAALVDDEVLLREAFARGLHESDYRVRKRLLAVMRSGLTQLVPNPSRAQLEAWYRKDLERFRVGASVDLEQVFFAWGSTKTPPDSAAFLAALRAGKAGADSGDTNLGGNVVRKVTRRDLVGRFGKAMGESVLQIEDEAWQGPFESGIGIHYVRITARHPSRIPPFDEVETFLSQEWVFQKTREAQQAKVDELRRKYRLEFGE